MLVRRAWSLTGGEKAGGAAHRSPAVSPRELFVCPQGDATPLRWPAGFKISRARRALGNLWTRLASRAVQAQGGTLMRSQGELFHKPIRAPLGPHHLETWRGRVHLLGLRRLTSALIFNPPSQQLPSQTIGASSTCVSPSLKSTCSASGYMLIFKNFKLDFKNIISMEHF